MSDTAEHAPVDEAIAWAKYELKYEQEEMRGNPFDHSERYLIVLCALRAYKAALSQPTVTPFAWAHRYVTGDALCECWKLSLHDERAQYGNSIPLYTHPTGDKLTPVPAPVDSELTDEEILAIHQRCPDNAHWIVWIRMVIAADRAKRNESTREAVTAEEIVYLDAWARNEVIEECAKVCDSLHRWHFGEDEPHSGPSECASEIRALSTKGKAGGEA